MKRVVLLLAVVFGASGCLENVAPPGDGPLRYRDAVFSDVTTTSGIVYGSAVNESGDTQQLALDLYEPAGDTAAARPAVVWVHGGSFRTGNRTSPELVDEATTLGRQGYVSVSISYRLSSVGCASGGASVACLAEIVDAKHDAQAAVRFLRAHAAEYRIDPDRIAIGGTSAGAITALNVAYGADDVGTSGNPGPSSQVRAAVSLSGAAILTQPDPGEPPALLFHGTADFVVPYAWAEATASTAQSEGLVGDLVSWEGDGHVPYVKHRSEILEQTSNFLWWTLDLAHAAV
jgi:acetyl esterase/lipase